MNHLTPIPFHDQTLLAVEHNGMLYVAMRPIVENLGLAWKPQFVKLSQGRWERTVTTMVTVAEDGKSREMLCLPATKIAAFLYSIDPNKVKPELHDRVITYQEECDEVLHRHWMAKHDQEHNALNALLGAHFARHPGWLDLVLLAGAGLSQRAMAERLGIHRRNVQRKLRRIERAGIDWRHLPADALAQPAINQLH